MTRKYRIAITIEKNHTQKGMSEILWLKEEDFEDLDELAERLLNTLLGLKEEL